MKKNFLLILAMIFILSACQKKIEPKVESVKTNIDTLQEVINYVPVIDHIVENGRIITQNKYLNLELEEEYLFPNELFDDISIHDIGGSRNFASTYQYYQDRLVIGCESCGGKSYVGVLNGEKIESKVIQQNIILYDEKTDTYYAQSRSGDGFEILDGKGEKILKHIPLPVTQDELIGSSIALLSPEILVYFGKHNGRAFNLMRYDFQSERWIDLLEFSEFSQEMEGFGNISYNENYSDWISITVNQLYDKSAEEVITVNKVFFVNYKTLEKREYDNLTYRAPFAFIQGSDYSIAVDSDQITFIDPNPDNPQVVKTLYVEALNPNGDNHINSLIQYIPNNRLIIFVPNGYVKYDLNTNESEYIIRSKSLKEDLS
jgi:hypothetical protein